MCQFHKNVAVMVADDPLRNSIVLCALARYWIDRHLPTMAHLDGYSDYEMATPAAVAALQNSGMVRDLTVIADFRQSGIPVLRRAVDKVVNDLDLTLYSLRLSSSALVRTKTLNNMMVSLYDGNPAEGLTVKTSIDNAKYDPMRRAVELFFQQPGVEKTLESVIDGMIAEMMLAAQGKINPSLMRIYTHLPQDLRTSFGACSMHAGGAHAVFCFGVPAAAAAAGATTSHAVMGGLMFAAAPVAASVFNAAADWYRGYDFSWKKMLATAGAALAVAGAINYAQHGGDHMDSAKAGAFYQLDPKIQKVEIAAAQTLYHRLPSTLREQLDDRARAEKLSPALYLIFCGGDDLSREIAAFAHQARDGQKALAPR